MIPQTSLHSWLPKISILILSSVLILHFSRVPLHLKFHFEKRSNPVLLVNPAIISTFYPHAPTNASSPVLTPSSDACNDFNYSLHSLLSSATLAQSRISYATLRPSNPSPGLTVAYDRDSSYSKRFFLSTEPDHPLHLHALARLPFCHQQKLRPVALRVLQNVYYGKFGTVYDPNLNVAHELGGGCCEDDWEWKLPEKTFRIDGNAIVSFNTNRNDIVLVLAQHHGETYHHALFDALPRYLAVHAMLKQFPHIRVAIDDSNLVEDLLVLFGLDPQRIVRTGKRFSFRFAKLLLYPPPMFQDTVGKRKYYNPDCIERAVALMLKSAVLNYGQERQNQTMTLLKKFPFPSKSVYEDVGTAQVLERVLPQLCKREGKPIIVLLERALGRGPFGCRGNRCISNFKELKEGIEQRFGKAYDLVVYPPKAKTVEAVGIFDKASIVVGMHGGGFQNLMFCRPDTDVVHIGWGLHYKKTAINFGLRYHLFMVEGLHLGAQNNHVDVDGILKMLYEIVNRRKDDCLERMSQSER
ncbi:unnamed protein product [Chondrus crispus]|uniref:Glycosyltransferase 61 catalytic domain-containing protein n=1 Tax=Chondrus crispus TaxID=2769 RepID=R7Q3E7_CHOCR|nr:unnamed protein product [Chondrus crispus]CDF32529.1 unnamed protein product [Chondrus crispus]|eukprot:XP_005712194.1 unnamed protein product [Chondrus crispus]